VTLVDAGPLIAMFHSSDADHQRCLVAAQDLDGPLIASWAVLGEAMHVLGRWQGWRGQRALWTAVLDAAVEVRNLDPEDAPRAFELMRRYRDTPMDLGDASLVVLGEKLGIDQVFTLDKHFRAYRLHGRRAFHVVPG